MDMESLIAQWGGKLTPGFVRPVGPRTGRSECKLKRCRNKVTLKRLEGDILCQRCRGQRDAERARKCQDAADAAAIDEFAAKPGRVHRVSDLDCGVSLWNGRPKPQPSAAYWSPLPVRSRSRGSCGACQYRSNTPQ